MLVLVPEIGSKRSFLEKKSLLSDRLQMHKPFLNWFNSMPLVCQQKLARIIWMLITDDISDMALPSEDILFKFKLHVSSIDIPLRKAARITMIIAITDSIMENIFDFLNIDQNFKDLQLEKKLISLEEKIWEKIRENWYKVRESFYPFNLLSLALKNQEGSNP